MVAELPFITTAQDDGILSVGQLAGQIARVLEADPVLCDVAVRGEISNFKAASSGHVYFTLKDGDAQIRCCLWKSQASRLRFRPSDGDRVVATGGVEFYKARGDVSFIVRTLRFDGQGALAEAFERLKAQLAAEGIFDPARKRPMPKYPRRIGLITSPTGAVAHDVVSVLRRRWPPATIVFIPAAVQGVGAVPELLRGLELAGALGNLDLVIVARGGGSAEDLWCFNDEDLARAVGRCPIPVISAVGHETDFTIFDFAADLRAPTPSVAAELAAPDIRDVQGGLLQLRRRLNNALGSETRLARSRLETARARLALAGPGERLRRLRLELGVIGTRVRDSARHRVKIEAQKIAGLGNQLRALHPQRILERGYTLVRDENGDVLATAAAAAPGRKLRIFWHDGAAAATVDDD